MSDIRRSPLFAEKELKTVSKTIVLEMNWKFNKFMQILIITKSDQKENNQKSA